MSPKQNNIDSDQTFDHKTPDVTKQETEPSFNKTRARAVVMLASLIVGGFVIYEKLSPSVNNPSPNNIAPVEQNLPESSNPKGGNNNLKATSNSQSEKKTKTVEGSDGKQYKAIVVDNYDELIPDLPVDRRNAIDITLYNEVKNNLKSDNLDISDAVIRDGSVKSTYDKSSDIHSGSFTVDIPSIKESYTATYEWSSNKNNTNLEGGYTATVACLPSDELIYGNFDCVDDFGHSISKAEQDPILQYLPHSTLHYTVTGNYDSNNKLDLNVAIYIDAADITDGGTQATAVSKYTAEVNDWIKSEKLNPSDYSINYNAIY